MSRALRLGLPLLLLPAIALAAEATGAAPSSHGWLSVLPPVLAIALALATRQVVVALVLGVYTGALVVTGDPFHAFLRLGDTYLTDAVADRSHAAILVFTTILGGMVGVLSRSGATEGVVHWLSGRVGGRRGGMVSTAVMGTVIFFDDYANTLLVGATMRPLTDRLRISREKLSWLVDSTAAPVTTVAVISTWVGFEVGLIQDAMARMGADQGAYGFFVRSIPYSFYPLLTIAFVYMVSLSGRDFGPMLAAEERALQRGQVLRPGARPASDVDELTSQAASDLAPAHPFLAGLPILLVIVVTALGIYFGGRQAARAAGLAEPTLREILNNADSFAVLTWAALTGAVSAIVLVVGRRRLSLTDALEGWVQGARSMVIAMTILVLAWSMSAVCDALGTAPFLVEVAKQVLSARLLPAVVFVLAAAVSFATGTSWGTMAILMPLVYPLGIELPASAGLAGPLAHGIHLAAVSAVLAGAVFGDHCSPISDTTILSSLATGSDHVDHVRTQLPYALVVAFAALLLGYLPAGWGMSPWLGLGLGALALLIVVLRVGRRAEDRPFEVLP
ncbi:MAG TPA: Na+/H+ antiporter NhaC family protein [Candidatus Krumholzibacteria bacterium]|nr:Na+/H+ antiporter NhaC family protein [Candidatus Krumholzibacteria bacterium]